MLDVSSHSSPLKSVRISTSPRDTGPRDKRGTSSFSYSSEGKNISRYTNMKNKSKIILSSRNDNIGKLCSGDCIMKSHIIIQKKLAKIDRDIKDIIIYDDTSYSKR